MNEAMELKDRYQKAPRGAGELIVYLDFDGVLHHENVLFTKRGAKLLAPPGHKLFQHVDLLVEILAPYPQILIVLSTSWVGHYGCAGAARRLPGALRERVIGATYHSKMMGPVEFYGAPRGMQVWGDVVKRKPKDWIALDDDYLHWPKWCLDKYVRTDEIEGISHPGARAEIVDRLGEMCA